MIEIRKERYAFEELSVLASKAFEHHHGNSNHYSDTVKDNYRFKFTPEQLELHFHRRDIGKYSTRFVAVDGTKYVGMIDVQNQYILRRLYVDPDYLGQNISTDLVNACIDYMKNETNETHLYAKTFLYHNMASFWEGFGFTKGEITHLSAESGYTYRTMILDLSV